MVLSLKKGKGLTNSSILSANIQKGDISASMLFILNPFIFRFQETRSNLHPSQAISSLRFLFRYSRIHFSLRISITPLILTIKKGNNSKITIKTRYLRHLDLKWENKPFKSITTCPSIGLRSFKKIRFFQY